eukprot:CAMPEP_0185280320 /NCGR_PEP_ID=MMETSP1359-20130426/65822_1 /TAXON_ID=552665 /ORGANISM="Bigelowiella longifila, Strain CCMP242" /LENGTH=189 /DNA_ID=CAMNT_0027875525 /DNA_START=274 /DNA_END=843 /DNA_ORIENTATION=+
MLQNGASFTQLAQYGDEDVRVPALLRACRHNRLDALRLMLAQHTARATPRSRNPFDTLYKTVGGSYPIHTATAAGHRSVVRFLVEEAKADVNAVAQTEYGGTALYSAVRHGDSGVDEDDAMIRDLIEMKADVNHRDDKGATALVIACVAGKASFVQVLLDLDADPDIADGRGKTAVDYTRNAEISDMFM